MQMVWRANVDDVGVVTSTQRLKISGDMGDAVGGSGSLGFGGGGGGNGRYRKHLWQCLIRLNMLLANTGGGHNEGVVAAGGTTRNKAAFLVHIDKVLQKL